MVRPPGHFRHLPGHFRHFPGHFRHCLGPNFGCQCCQMSLRPRKGPKTPDKSSLIRYIVHRRHLYRGASTSVIYQHRSTCMCIINMCIYAIYICHILHKSTDNIEKINIKHILYIYRIHILYTIIYCKLYIVLQNTILCIVYSNCVTT